MSAAKRRSRASSQQDKLELTHKIDSLSKENERLKDEIESLEQKLSSSKRMSDVSRSSVDRSDMVDVYKKENMSLKEELKKLKVLLEESEKHREGDVNRFKEDSKQIVKLTEVKNLLQQQVELGGVGGTVAEKQVRSLEKRLKVTEDRLHSERADRAGKLSEVEDKLINENAKLQFSEKEARRQLQREKDKVRNLDNKLRTLREENEQGSLSSRTSSSGTRKTESIESMQRHDARLVKLQEQVDDAEHGRKGLEDTYKQEISHLVKEKHSIHAQLQSMEDVVAGMRVENDSLKASLIEKGARESSSLANTPRHFESQFEALKGDLRSKEEDLQSTVRKNKLLQSEMDSLISQLAVTEKSLEDQRRDMKRLTQTRSSEDETAEWKQHRIDKLSAEVQSARSEFQTLQEKYNKLSVDKMELEDTVTDLEGRVQHNRSRQSRDRMNESLESEKMAMENELSEKETQVMHLTSQYNQSEDELQRTKQNLILEQEQSAQLAAQISDLSKQLWENDESMKKLNLKLSVCENDRSKFQDVLKIQGHLTSSQRAKIEDLQEDAMIKSRQIGHLSDETRTQRIELDTLRENNDHINRDLTAKLAEAKIATTDSCREKAKCSKLAKQLEIKYLTEEPKGTLQDKQNRIKLLEIQKENLEHEIAKCTTILEASIKENASLLQEIRQLNQIKLNDKAMLQQITRERVEIKQKYQYAFSEKESLSSTNHQLQMDLSKRETDLHQLNISVGEGISGVQEKYKDLSPAGKRVANELETTRKLLEAREKEIDLVQDSLNRQKMESEAIHRKFVLTQEENERKKEEIEKMSVDLNHRLRELSSAHETNQAMNHEKSEHQVELLKLQQELHREKENTESRRTETVDAHKKLESTDDAHKATERFLHKKENRLAITETELLHSKRTVMQLNSEIEELKSKVQRLTRDKLSVQEINSTLDKRLHSEKNTLTEQKISSTHFKQECERLQRELEAKKKDHNDAIISWETEKKMAASLKEKLMKEEEFRYKFEDDVRGLKFERDSLNAKISSNKDSAESLKEDKQKLYKEIEGLSRKISKKDNLISQLQEKCSQTVGKVNSEYAIVNRQKDTLEDELSSAKREINELNERIREKESHVNDMSRAVQDFEDEKQAKLEAESRAKQLEVDVEENTMLLETFRSEISSLKEANNHLREKLDKMKQQNGELNSERSDHQRAMSKQIEDLRDMMAENNSRNEAEKMELRDKLNKTLSDMKSVEVSLNATSETKDHFHNTNRYLEKTVDTLKSQLHEEITSRKMSEDRLQTAKQQLDELRRKKITTDEKLEDYHATTTKLQADLEFEKEKVSKLKEEYNELETTCYSHEARNQTLQEHNDGLQTEFEVFKQKHESQKLHLSTKNKRTVNDLKQQSESFDKEKNRMSLEMQQITIQLQQARDHLSAKNLEVLKMSERMADNEDKLRETTAQLHQSENTLKSETLIQDKLSNRNQDLELELIELKSQLTTRGCGEAPTTDKDNIIRSEMTRMLKEIQFQMMLHNKGASEPPQMEGTYLLKLIEGYKEQVNSLQSELSSEQSMHEVTKKQLAFVEEDNEKLREHIKKLRKQKSNTPERPTKSRMEEINERIARSQMHAQAMLMSGTSLLQEDTMRACSIPPDYNLANNLLTSMTSHFPRPNSVLAESEGHDSLNSTFQEGGFGTSTLQNTLPMGFRPFNSFK